MGLAIGQADSEFLKQTTSNGLLRLWMVNFEFEQVITVWILTFSPHVQANVRIPNKKWEP